MICESDQRKKLWFMQEGRRTRVIPFPSYEALTTSSSESLLMGLIHQGEVENVLIDLAVQHRDSFDSFVVKPGYVLSKETRIMQLVIDLSRFVRVDELAAVLMNTALNGSEVQITEYNEEGTRGRAVLNGSE